MTERATPGRPKATASDTLVFLLSLVPYLIEHESVSVDTVARHFNRTPKQVREAVTLIAVSGIPGETGTYQAGDLFDLAWDDFENDDQIRLTHLVAIDEAPRFSAREAAALIAGLQYLSNTPEHADGNAIDSLLVKLARGSSGVPSPVAVEGAEADATLGLIRSAVESGLQLEFDYLGARGERERRRVDPLRVESLDVDWYLRGWCHLREAVRTFRLDRIVEPRLTSEPVRFRAPDIPLSDSLFEQSGEDIPVTLELRPAVLPQLADYLPAAAELESHGDRLRVTIPMRHFHGLKRLVAGLAGDVTVVGPADARAAVSAWAAAALRGYAP